MEPFSQKRRHLHIVPANELDERIRSLEAERLRPVPPPPSVLHSVAFACRCDDLLRRLREQGPPSGPDLEAES